MPLFEANRIQDCRKPLFLLSPALDTEVNMINNIGQLSVILVFLQQLTPMPPHRPNVENRFGGVVSSGHGLSLKSDGIGFQTAPKGCYMKSALADFIKEGLGP
jgi:hypothetical protein